MKPDDGSGPAGPARSTAGILTLYFIVAVAAGLITSKVITSAVARSWHDCDAAGPGDHLILAVMWLPNAIAVALWWVLALIVSHRLRGRVHEAIRLPLTLLVCVIGSLSALWIMMHWLHDPGGTIVNPVCPPGNTPPWWPTWLPL
ncbi:hypothetical protein [Nocardia sp. R6R-6]|uniref:hypothetical protein n=1 Tax=Nocardia sp. R6R-6 TaxID=3459303 RepID=UPI00403D6D82